MLAAQAAARSASRSSTSGGIAARSDSVLRRQTRLARTDSGSPERLSTSRSSRAATQSRVSAIPGFFVEVLAPERVDEPDDLAGEPLAGPRHPGAQDGELALRLGELDEDVEAPAPERVGEVTGAVQDDVRDLFARIVPSSGTETWKSESTSSRYASNSSSARSISSMRSTGASSWVIASRSGRRRR